MRSEKCKCEDKLEQVKTLWERYLKKVDPLDIDAITVKVTDL